MELLKLEIRFCAIAEDYPAEIRCMGINGGCLKNISREEQPKSFRFFYYYQVSGISALQPLYYDVKMNMRYDTKYDTKQKEP